MALIAAALVHLLTASGAVLALLALVAAAQGEWHAMFVWLGIALIVDAVDGPLARKVKVDAALPRISGRRLDFIVDYLTYVAVPAFALTEAALLPEWSRLPAASVILLSALFAFVNRKSKTEEGYFLGFPALWNVVLFYLFALGLPPAAALAAVVLFVLLTFVPLPWLHPLRVVKMRPLTLAVTALWSLSALAALLQPFPSPPLVQAGLVLTAIYLAGAGALLARTS